MPISRKGPTYIDVGVSMLNGRIANQVVKFNNLGTEVLILLNCPKAEGKDGVSIQKVTKHFVI